jgi:tetratricopeptide (TPR) repeat protein
VHVIVSSNMHLLRSDPVASTVLVLTFTASLLGAKGLAQAQNPASQTKSSASSKPTRHDSADVVATLSPEEAEEGRLNDAYQSIAQQQRKGTCTAAIIDRYRSEVLPLAEKAAFNVPKNKFLFLANRDIGNCYLAQQDFVQAEASFQKILQYAPVWPGTDDSAYPVNLRQIATAQMGQQRWQAAEESLQKSLSLFDSQIDRALKSDSEFFRTEHAGNLRGSKATTLALLGIVYLREARTADALNTVDLAYAETKKPNVSPSFVGEVVQIGRSIAQATGDKEAIAKWSQRS